MRILIISNLYPPYERGGYEQLCRDVAERLAARGHTVQVLTSTHGLDGGPVPVEPGIERALHLSPKFGTRLGEGWEFVFGRRQAERHNARVTRAAVQAFRPDVIFVWNVQRLPRSITLEAEAAPDPAVAYWLAGYSPAEPDEYWAYWQIRPGNRAVRAAKRLLASAAFATMRREGKPVYPKMRHVAVVSAFMRDKGIADGTLPLHARVIYNGVEIEHFYRPVQTELAGPLGLLQAGRVSEDKGVHTAIESIGLLAREHHLRTVHLHVAGSGPAAYLAHLKHLVGQYGVEDMVSFHGWLPRERMPELMAQCQVLLLPTVNHEPFARVVLEAMASGLAVVGTLTGGTGELLQPGVTGLAFAAGEGHDLAKQIARLLSDPGLRVRVATQGQQMVCERFDLERMVDAVEGLLNEAVAARDGAG